MSIRGTMVALLDIGVDSLSETFFVVAYDRRVRWWSEMARLQQKCAGSEALGFGRKTCRDGDAMDARWFVDEAESVDLGLGVAVEVEEL